MNNNVEVVSATEFISRVAACLAANAVITRNGEYADKQFPSWRVLPHGRNCSPMTYISASKKWWQFKFRVNYGTANGPKVTTKLTRWQYNLIVEMVKEADTAVAMVIDNPWSVIDY